MVYQIQKKMENIEKLGSEWQIEIIDLNIQDSGSRIDAFFPSTKKDFIKVDALA